MSKKRMITSVIGAILGLGLIVFSLVQDGKIDQVTIVGLAFFVIGMLQILRYIKYRTDASYKEKVDISDNDERNTYISNKAWAWAGYCYVLIMAIAMIVLLIMGRMEYLILSGGLCLMVVLYWVCYLVLNRKY